METTKPNWALELQSISRDPFENWYRAREEEIWKDLLEAACASKYKAEVRVGYINDMNLTTLPDLVARKLEARGLWCQCAVQACGNYEILKISCSWSSDVKARTTHADWLPMLRRFSEDPQSGAFEIWFEKCQKEILEKLRSAAGRGYCCAEVSVGYLDNALDLATLPENLKRKLEARGLTVCECKIGKNSTGKHNVVKASCSWSLPDSPVRGTVLAVTPSTTDFVAQTPQ